MNKGLRRPSGGPNSWALSDLGAFYAEYRADFTGHALRLLKNKVRAEEVVQEAILKFILAAPELSSEAHASNYIHRTIENLCKDIFRAEGRRPNLILLEDATGEMERNWQSQKDHSDNMSAAEDAAVVRQALSMLSPAERSAIVMWEIEGRSKQEIARELGIKESAVRHTVSRARASLRRVLTEYIIDEKRGLTAVDFLSVSYKKAADLAKKSSKVALSFILLITAFLGFNSLGISSKSPLVNVGDKAANSSGNPTKVTSPVPAASGTMVNAQSKGKASISSSVKSLVKVSNAKSSELSFAGLGKDGVPTGFTIADSSGNFGSLYLTLRSSVVSDVDLTASQLVKTNAPGVANLFITQSLVTDSNGMTYNPLLSYGRDGKWVPLVSRVGNTELTRLINGSYLFTAFIKVEFEVESPIKVAATAVGRDLGSAPRQVITKIVLDPSKTQVLAQAVYVVEKGAK